MVRLTDFAEQNRITARTVQLHIQANADELEGHIDRRGKKGTWLDDYAVNFLLSVIQLPTKEDVVVPTMREAELMAQVAEVTKKWAEAERRAGVNAEAAGKVMLLEAVKASQEAQISSLGIELGETREKLRGAEKEAQERYDEAMEAIKDLDDAKKSVADLEEKLARAEKERDDALAQNEAIKQRDEALKQLGPFAKLAWIFRKGE